MITIIFGGVGEGKTSLMTHLLNEIAFDRERNRAMQNEIASMNANGFNLTIPQHCVSANYNITFKKFGYTPRKNRIINPFRLGFQQGAPYRMHYMLPYEAVGIDEAQKYFYSKGKHLPSFVSNWFEEHRHNNMDIFLSVQRATLIDKNIRDISQAYHVLGKKVKVNKNGDYKIIWTINKVAPGDIDDYLSAPKDEKKNYCEQITITANYNVYLLYDSQGCRYRFLEGHLNQDFDLNYKSIAPITHDDYKKYIDAFIDRMPGKEEILEEVV